MTLEQGADDQRQSVVIDQGCKDAIIGRPGPIGDWSHVAVDCREHAGSCVVWRGWGFYTRVGIGRLKSLAGASKQYAGLILFHIYGVF